MKYLSALLFGMPFLIYGQNVIEKNLIAEINSVTVYQQNGLINRSGKTELPAGKSTLILKSLSPYIDPNSIQVKAKGKFTVLSVNHKLDYLNNIEQDQKVKDLMNSIKSLEIQIRKLQSRIEVLAEKKSLLSVNKNLGGQNQGATVTELKQAIEFYELELTSIKSEEIDIELKINDLKEAKRKLEQEVDSERRKGNLPSGKIEISIDAKTPTNALFEISYLVRNTGWIPKYDIRVADIQQPLELTYKADIFQNTGVEWKNVKLTLSNGNPNQSGIAPELDTWFLGFVNTNSMKKSYYSTKALRATRGAVAESEFNEAPEEISADQSILEEASPITTFTSENQTTIEFEIEQPYTIKSNGDRSKVELNRYQIETTYQYYAVPKLDKDAFLIARIYNWEQYNLLEGETNLYFEDTYVGKSFLNSNSSKDTLDISLGRDKSIVIDREKTDTFSKKNTIGSNKVESREFLISVRNKKSQFVRIKVFDQIPIATLNTIDVTPIELSKGLLNAKTGEISWELELDPQTQKELKLSYEVKYPKNERVILE